MEINAAATQNGLSIIKKHLHEKVKQFVVIGHEGIENKKLSGIISGSDINFEKIKPYILLTKDITEAYNDVFGVLTFELDLPYEANLSKYIYAVAIISTANELVSISPTPMIYKATGVGGKFIYKVAVDGKPCELIFNNKDSEYATTKETIEGKVKYKSIDPHLLKQSLNNFKETFPTSGFRNKIINGNFSIWQRGESFEVKGYGYTSDRWVTNNFYNNPERNTIDFTIEKVSYKNLNGIRLSMPSGHKVATGYNWCYVAQRVEGDYRGKTMTLSFSAKAVSEKYKLDITIRQYFNKKYSGESFNFALSSEFKRYSVTFTVSDNQNIEHSFPTDNLSVYFKASEKGFFELYNVQLEEGEIATPFEERPLAIEETLCKRYFERLTGVVGSGFIHHDGNGAAATLIFQKKRVMPSINIVGDTMFANGYSVAKANSYELQYQKLNCVLLRGRLASKIHSPSGVVAIQDTGHIDINAEI